MFAACSAARTSIVVHWQQLRWPLLCPREWQLLQEISQGQCVAISPCFIQLTYVGTLPIHTEETLDALHKAAEHERQGKVLSAGEWYKDQQGSNHRAYRHTHTP